MGQETIVHARSLLIAGAVLTLLAGTTNAMATLHVIQFGGTLGLTYSPSSLSVSVGDTIEWRGAFSSHPLSSSTIPGGAASWHQGTGTVFDYVVTVPGTYNYRCDIHGSLGMVGSFVAAATDVGGEPNGEKPTSPVLDQNYPNPFNPTTTIRYGLPQRSAVRLTIFNSLGQAVATLSQEEQEPGYHEVRFDASRLASGVYLCRLQAGNLVQTRKLLLQK